MKYLFLLILSIMFSSSCAKKQTKVDDKIVSFVGAWIALDGTRKMNIFKNGIIQFETSCGKSGIKLLGKATTLNNNFGDITHVSYEFETKKKYGSDFRIKSNLSYDTISISYNDCQLNLFASYTFYKFK